MSNNHVSAFAYNYLWRGSIHFTSFLNGSGAPFASPFSIKWSLIVPLSTVICTRIELFQEPLEVGGCLLYHILPASQQSSVLFSNITAKCCRLRGIAFSLFTSLLISLETSAASASMKGWRYSSVAEITVLRIYAKKFIKHTEKVANGLDSGGYGFAVTLFTVTLPIFLKYV